MLDFFSTSVAASVLASSLVTIPKTQYLSLEKVLAAPEDKQTITVPFAVLYFDDSPSS